MEKHELNRLEAALRKMMEDYEQVEEWSREAKERRAVFRSTAGNMIRRRKGKKDKRLTANVIEKCSKSP
jgi:endo-alpha-1,4-polygalactosaminidase (GH114 family)